MLNNLINSIKEAKTSTKIAGVISLFLVVVIILVTVVYKPNNIDADYGDDGSGDYFLYHARLHNISELENAINKNSRTFDLIAVDVMTFGRKTIPAYSTNPPKVVGFAIDSKKLSTKDKTISFEGKYGSSKDKIKISFELLNNDRIKNKITNLNTGFSMESELSSNNELNKFIATLPVTEKDFNIYYSKEQDFMFRIDLANNSQATRNNAISYLKNKAGEEFVSDENVLMYYITNSFDQQRTEYIQTYISGNSAL